MNFAQSTLMMSWSTQMAHWKNIKSMYRRFFKSYLTLDCIWMSTSVNLSNKEVSTWGSSYKQEREFIWILRKFKQSRNEPLQSMSEKFEAFLSLQTSISSSFESSSELYDHWISWHTKMLIFTEWQNISRALIYSRKCFSVSQFW